MPFCDYCECELNDDNRANHPRLKFVCTDCVYDRGLDVPEDAEDVLNHDMSMNY